MKRHNTFWFGCFSTLIVATTVGCVQSGFLTDGTTVSVGTHSNGVLRYGRRLPFRGEGYLIPNKWKERQRNYGTDELVELLIRTSRRVQHAYGESYLGIADLSPKSGGKTPQHHSHHSGRDVDLVFYSMDLAGRPLLPPNEMISYNSRGFTVVASNPEQSTSAHPESTPSKAEEGVLAGTPQRRIDVARNWFLIKTLVTDEQTPVQWLFIGRDVAEALISHARRVNEPEWLIERAARLMHQPSDAGHHNDHIHVRIFCPVSDRALGCTDAGPPRWLKKSIKYRDLPVETKPIPDLPLLLIPQEIADDGATVTTAALFE